eukprot:symbB.v1.2.009000.t3/scaffold565.1/size187815/13
MISHIQYLWKALAGSSAMVTRAVIENGQAPDWSLLPKAALGVLALLCGNGYIVGINQIYDVSIDVINKPFLPVAAKELSVSQAWFATIAMAIGGTWLSYSLFGPLIGSLYAFGLFLGTIYSGNRNPSALKLSTPQLHSLVSLWIMRGVFVVALLAHLLCVSSESCENDLTAGIQQDDDASAVELLQVKSTQDSKDSKDAAVHGAEVGAEAKDVSENQWVHYNPPGARGGPGHGYTHHNPPGPRGGPGHGTTHVHHNPAGPRGGPGHGTTVVHHHGWR